jgi:hypothetical protein
VLCNIIRGDDYDESAEPANNTDGPHSFITSLGRHGQSSYFPSSSSYYINHNLQSWAIHSVACVVVAVKDWITAGREQEV